VNKILLILTFTTSFACGQGIGPNKSLEAQLAPLRRMEIRQTKKAFEEEARRFQEKAQFTSANFEKQMGRAISQELRSLGVESPRFLVKRTGFEMVGEPQLIGPTKLQRVPQAQNLAVIGEDQFVDGMLYSTVGFFYELNSTSYFCGSGVRIAEQVVLTADHVAEILRKADRVWIASGTNISKAAGVEIQKDWIGHRLKGLPNCRNDICKIRLNRYASRGLKAAIAEIYPVALTLEDRRIVSCGYGAYRSEIDWCINHGKDLNEEVKTSKFRPLSWAGIFLVPGKEAEDFCDEQEFAAGFLNLWKAGAAIGDSGGPAFVRLPGGKLQLVGIVARNGRPDKADLVANFSDMTVFTRVLPYKDK